MSESHMYACTACGAVVEADVRHVATRCAYCTAPLVDAKRAASAIDAIVPFRLSKRAAMERLRTHIGNRWWTPQAVRVLARKGQLQADAVQGVLVPFYAYDATICADYSARVGVHWHRKETVTVKRSTPKPDKAGETIHIEPEESPTQTRTVRETEWFDLRGSMGLQLDHHLVSASAGLSAERAAELTPFDLGRAANFDARLMLGWTAELPSKARRDIDAEAHNTLCDLGRGHLRRKHLTGDAHRIRTVEFDVEIHRVRLVLLPIWLATVRLGNAPVQIAINGQTGKVVGSIPTSKAKVAAVVAVVLLLTVLVVLWTRGDLPWM